LSGCEGDDLRDAPAADVADRAESVGAETTTDLAGEEDALPDEIRDYLAFVRESDPGQEAGPDHAYVSEGLERLAAALARVVERDDVGGGSLEGQLEDVRATAERVQEDPDSPRHAALVQAAFTSIADVFESLEKAGHPELASGTAGLRQAAQRSSRGSRS
ncbi:MAG: hypothetical protein ABR599_11130, partial [Gemmatimonadota bacterium]